jgi:hypothetical protein
MGGLVNCTGRSDCTCGCCAGTGVQTPQQIANRAGLFAIAYRTGTWATFKESMLARLSSADYPALRALKTRSDDDFTIAMLDATAIVLDILTFYQERLANENYLRTARQLRSLTELSRLIGYRPTPGVSASAYLAFSLRQTPGLPPDPTAPPITIPQGTQVQSVPPQGQQPQTFETSAPIQAKADWSELTVQTTKQWIPQIGDTSVYLAGTVTQLQPGDLFLIVGDERSGPPPIPSNNNWDIRVVTTVNTDDKNKRTYVGWNEALGAPDGTMGPAQSNPKFYAFRQRGALFGYNAVQPMIVDTTNLHLAPIDSTTNDWNFETQATGLYQGSLIDLDAVYPKIVPGGWIALIKPDGAAQRSPSGTVTLYKVISTTAISRSDFALSSKLSRALVDSSTSLADYYSGTRTTSALVNSEELIVAEQPLLFPLYGRLLSLKSLRTDMAGIQVLALTGKRQKLAVKAGINPPLQFVPDDGSYSARALAAGEVLTLTDPSTLPTDTEGSLIDWQSYTQPLTLYVEDSYGRTGEVIQANNTVLANFTLTASDKSDPEVSEYALGQVDSTSDAAHTQFKLQSPLTYCYERASTTVNANVGPATHGQSVSEIMGNGNAATANQSFSLKQSPLTFVSAATPSGRASSLQVQVNEVKWTEVPSLYQQPPSAQVFSTLNQSDGSTDVLFGGDGEGARLPSGQNNIRASYRVKTGLAGNVAAGTLTSLIDRPLGVSSVTNPEAASGGQEPQSLSDIRANAPQSVLTLGRVVSIADYQNYASTFAGISKAYAIWIPSGPGRGIFLTVAGAGGAAVQPGSATLLNLVNSLRQYGNPLVPITVQSFVETLFTFSAGIQYDPAYDQLAVQAQVALILTQSFSFAARSFGQGVSVDEISAVIQSAPGVVAVNVSGLARVASNTSGDLTAVGYATISQRNQWFAGLTSITGRFADPPGRLCAYLPIANPLALPQPAEILVIDPRPGSVTLTVIS